MYAAVHALLNRQRAIEQRHPFVERLLIHEHPAEHRHRGRRPEMVGAVERGERHERLPVVRLGVRVAAAIRLRGAEIDKDVGNARVIAAVQRPALFQDAGVDRVGGVVLAEVVVRVGELSERRGQFGGHAAVRRVQADRFFRGGHRFTIASACFEDLAERGGRTREIGSARG